MNDNEKPSLLLHACCAPCSPHVLNLLEQDYSVTVLFYNPNIQPEEEYRKREEEIRRFSAERGFELIVGDYNTARWLDETRGLEGEPEGGRRCRVCFRHRLDRAAFITSQLGQDIFTTTLTVSPHKNAGVINEEGESAAKRHGVKFLKSDFKKKDGFKISCDLSDKYGFYRQDFCGCIFSRR